ncbi:MAG: hypothetical protein P1U58_05265 [Verrucomicrobiales bacterium]|nr:hypothetical protein [Verrucomicrobiales bacterium]
MPSFRFPLFALLYFAFASPLLADDVEVTDIRRAYHNGEHNAFTDLVRWKGKFWLTFRSCPDGHMVHPTSSIRILCSTDTKEWTEVHRFSVKRRDVRDPHFLVFRDKLFVYTGTWWSGDDTLPREDYNLNQHLGYAVHSDDGNDWSAPTQLEGTYGHYIWRAATHEGKAYLCGRRKRAYSEQHRGTGSPRIVESAMLESDDGLVWKFHSLFQPDRGDETAFLFEPDGALIAVSRSGSEPAQLVRADPPWQEKSRIDFPDYIGGPLLAKWGDRYLVGGRRNTTEGARTALYWLEGETLIQFATLPSGGDNSYPGFVELDNGNGLVSWYSSHEKDEDGNPITAIYLAELVAKR